MHDFQYQGDDLYCEEVPIQKILVPEPGRRPNPVDRIETLIDRISNRTLRLGPTKAGIESGHDIPTKIDQPIRNCNESLIRNIDEILSGLRITDRLIESEKISAKLLENDETGGIVRTAIDLEPGRHSLERLHLGGRIATQTSERRKRTGIGTYT